LQRHVEAPEATVEGRTVSQVLDGYFRDHPGVRRYVLDDQGALRKHMVVFVDGQQVDDRTSLADPVGASAEVYVMQALSGGTQ